MATLLLGLADGRLQTLPLRRLFSLLRRAASATAATALSGFWSLRRRGVASALATSTARGACVALSLLPAAGSACTGWPFMQGGDIAEAILREMPEPLGGEVGLELSIH